MTEKIKVVKVEINRAEGPSNLCGWKTVSTLAEGNLILAVNAETAPKGGAYDKHDFILTFADGETYKGRIDVHHPSHYPVEKIGKHVIDFLRFYGGLLEDHELPSHMTPKKYREFVDRNKPEQQDYIDFLEKYDLADF